MPGQTRRTSYRAEVDRKDLRAGNNARALGKTLRAISGIEADVHAALVQHAKTLALLVDTVPGEASFHREYREALRELRGLGADAKDAFDLLMDEINAS